MMILALAAHERYPNEQRKEALLQELANGIAHQERSDGTLAVRGARGRVRAVQRWHADQVVYMH
jgi:hypothetical protein